MTSKSNKQKNSDPDPYRYQNVTDQSSAPFPDQMALYSVQCTPDAYINQSDIDDDVCGEGAQVGFDTRQCDTAHWMHGTHDAQIQIQSINLRETAMSDEEAPVNSLIGPGDAAFRINTISINNKTEHALSVETEITGKIMKENITRT